MHFSDILLIIISSAGLLHGLLIGIYLCFIKKKRTLPNLLLGLILIFMALRIGKSVMLHFGEALEPLYIFIGLAFLLAIGPLLRWYILSMLTPNFKTSKYFLWEWAPFIVVLIMSLFIRTDWFHTDNNQAIVLFATTIIFIYCHLAFYIINAGQFYWKLKKRYTVLQGTKSQKAIMQWLPLLVLGYGIIWISYVLNIIEDTVPYIIGPMMYSAVIYVLTYKAYQLRILDLTGNAFKVNDDVIVFTQIKAFFEEKQLYLDPNVSLLRIGKLVGKSAQKTSEIINQHAECNFNDFVNYYRIQEAKKLLHHPQKKHFTISSIAFDIGFSSLSSFNSAFKKFEAKTPSAYRKALEL